MHWCAPRKGTMAMKRTMIALGLCGCLLLAGASALAQGQVEDLVSVQTEVRYDGTVLEATMVYTPVEEDTVAATWWLLDAQEQDTEDARVLLSGREKAVGVYVISSICLYDNIPASILQSSARDQHEDDVYTHTVELTLVPAFPREDLSLQVHTKLRQAVEGPAVAEDIRYLPVAITDAAEWVEIPTDITIGGMSVGQVRVSHSTLAFCVQLQMESDMDFLVACTDAAGKEYALRFFPHIGAWPTEEGTRWLSIVFDPVAQMPEGIDLTLTPYLTGEALETVHIEPVAGSVSIR